MEPTFFFDHAKELRQRVLKSLAAWVISSAVIYFFSGKVISHLARPVGGLVFGSLEEAFLAHLRVAVWLGAVGSLPVWLYQAWRFFVPGLSEKEKKVLLFLALAH